MNQRSLLLAFCVATSSLLQAASDVRPSSPVAKEIASLRAARDGDASKVFQVVWFDGLVSFPNTLRVYPGSNQLYLSASMKSGHIAVGNAVPQQGGIRREEGKMLEVPSGSQSVEKIGTLTLEYYDAGKFDSQASAFLTDGHRYLWFTGDFVPLAREVAEVYAAPRGPNHSGDLPPPCYGSVISTGLTYSMSGKGVSAKGWTLYSAPADAASSFEALGFKAHDFIPIDESTNRPESLEEVFRRMAQAAGSTSIQVIRAGKPVTLTFPAGMLARKLPGCAGKRD